MTADAGATLYTQRPEELDGSIRGVASKYLDSYLDWRRMIDRDRHPSALSHRHCYVGCYVSAEQSHRACRKPPAALDGSNKAEYGG